MKAVENYWVNIIAREQITTEVKIQRKFFREVSHLSLKFFLTMKQRNDVLRKCTEG